MLRKTDYYQNKVTTYSVILMLLTSVHHVFGGIIYKTPWRFHVLFLSLPVIAATILLHVILTNGENRIIFWLHWIVTLLTSILLIGFFEGIYNHILKNLFFLSHVPVKIVNKLYPPGIYEQPNNWFFELSGVMQGIIAIPLTVNFIKLTRIHAFAKRTIKNNKKMIA
jgi:hypothetical protein